MEINSAHVKIAEIHGAAILYQISEIYETGTEFVAAKKKVVDAYPWDAVTPQSRPLLRQMVAGFNADDMDEEAHEAFISAVFDELIRPLCKWPRLSRFLWPLTGIYF